MKALITLKLNQGGIAIFRLKVFFIIQHSKWDSKKIQRLFDYLFRYISHLVVFLWKIDILIFMVLMLFCWFRAVFKNLQPENGDPPRVPILRLIQPENRNRWWIAIFRLKVFKNSYRPAKQYQNHKNLKVYFIKMSLNAKYIEIDYQKLFESFSNPTLIHCPSKKPSAWK